MLIYCEQTQGDDKKRMIGNSCYFALRLHQLQFFLKYYSESKATWRQYHSQELSRQVPTDSLAIFEEKLWLDIPKMLSDPSKKAKTEDTVSVTGGGGSSSALTAYYEDGSCDKFFHQKLFQVDDDYGLSCSC